MDGVARLLRSLAMTAGEIAGAARLSAERISAIMEGAPAELSELRALSRGLRLPMRAFATGGRFADSDSRLGALFRSAVGQTAPDQRATVDYVAGFVEAALDVLPPRDRAPAWLDSLRPARQTYEEAHRLAHGFRTMFMRERQDEPVLDLPELVTGKAGIILGSLRLSRYEGASVMAGDYGFAFVSPRFRPRMLFTLAHELGHLIAHHGQGKSAVFDSPKQIAARRQTQSDERFVDAFASVLLLPDRGVGVFLKGLREALGVTSDSVGDIEIMYLARFFGVSFEVAARRCEQLDLLPAGGAVSLTKAINRDFGSAERRADELGLPARPEIELPKVSDNLLEPLIEKIEKGAISTGWAVERFGMSIRELFDAHARLLRERRR